LLVIVVGSGSTRANLLAFGANQYQLPEQAEPLKLYFSLQIFAHKIGTVLGTFFNPILREDVACFGMIDCYPLTFGMAALAMVLTFVILLCGKSFFVLKPPSGNMFVEVSKCIMVSADRYLNAMKILIEVYRLESHKNSSNKK
jgi:solute carrier family 15 oligopeptide transporter 1